MPESKQDERLLAAMLTSLDEVSEGTVPQTHPDEETLAIFAAGALDGVERDTLVEHLDQCVACRKAAIALLMLPDETLHSWGGLPRPSLNEAQGDGLGSPPHGKAGGLGSPPHEIAERPRHFWRAPIGIAWFALAASLLLAVGLWWGTRSHDPQLAERESYRQVAALLVAGKFDDATRAVSQAEERGVVSNRLKSLRAEATRGIPALIALAQVGRLNDFGYEPGGVLARDGENSRLGKGLKPALEELGQAGSRDLEILLNRGHALLSAGRTQEALIEFEQAAGLDPSESLVWLGQGLAHFMLDDFSAAERDFRRSSDLDGKSVAAKMNLAMALEELNRTNEALELWTALSREQLASADRRVVDQALAQLRK